MTFLLACSGPGAQATMRAHEVGGWLLMAIAAFAVFGASVLKFRRSEIALHRGWAVGAVAVHPATWLHSWSGDCGFLRISLGIVVTTIACVWAVVTVWNVPQRIAQAVFYVGPILATFTLYAIAAASYVVGHLSPISRWDTVFVAVPWVMPTFLVAGYLVAYRTTGRQFWRIGILGVTALVCLGAAAILEYAATLPTLSMLAALTLLKRALKASSA